MARRRSQPLRFDLLLMLLDESSVAAQFDEGTFRRGDAYQREGRVSNFALDLDGDEPSVSAEVQGSDEDPYLVVVGATTSRGETTFRSVCTCPLESDCKHVVATLLQAVRQDLFVQLEPDPRWDPIPPPSLEPKSPPVPASPAVTGNLAAPIAAWLDRLGDAAGTAVAAQPKAAPRSEQILFCFSLRGAADQADRTSLTLVAARPLKAGGWSKARPLRLQNVAQPTAEFVTATDTSIARVLLSESGWHDEDWPRFATPESLNWAMEQILATGRARWLSKDGVVLRRDADQPGELSWRMNALGNQLPALNALEDGKVVLPGISPWVLDPASGACGRLLLPIPPAFLQSLLEAPAIPPEAAGPLADALAQRFPDLAIAPLRADVAVKIDTSPPVPVLRLGSRKMPQPTWPGTIAPPTEEWVDGAWLTFDYGGTEVAPDQRLADIRTVSGNVVTVRKRAGNFEKTAAKRLAQTGLARPHPYAEARVANALAGSGLTFSSALRPASGKPVSQDALAWPSFLHDTAGKLEAEGWRITVEDSFRHRIVSAEGEWQAEVEDKGAWWFSLDLGIDVQGERIALLPVLLAAIARLRPGEPLESLDHAGTLYSRMPDGRTLALPFARVRSLVGVLVELFGDRAPTGGASIDLSLAQAMGLEAIAEAMQLRWVGGQRLRDLATRLRQDGIGANDRAVPAGFMAELRSYQRTGFGWMRFLAENGLGGVLADDMGLGKTVQTLAHILAERQSGDMNAPVLVVCPTSLVSTWRDESARFAPDLRVLIMHGHGRPRGAEAFEGMDLVISTYPLLTRDGDLLESVVWHAVVLDEAQAIKNPASRWTQVAYRLKAGHRLCLTGTPVENHLGEAWSLFSFLMPGLLGDAKTFNRVFRTPIEKNQNSERRQLLARRIKPFMLRRTKAEVAAELPPKTEMIRLVDLAGGQRDLYETLRLAMDEKVRREVAARGLARSAIIILDALLKLRQACCDPRLVKLEAGAKSGAASAKLECLMELLPALVEEGRRVLLFSQFTSMLDLIKPELAKANIAFVELTGDTTDRATPVKTFQSGAVPVFLISLKAGGVGLTLTAADTVIHYDPWWNPAVEDQATDRAHRIGQDKPVFVYKLIAAGTVEERMLELQSRKRAVAASLFDPDNAASLDFSEDDLTAPAITDRFDANPRKSGAGDGIRTHDPNLGKVVRGLLQATPGYPKPLRLPTNTMVCYDALRRHSLDFPITVDTMWTPF
eukprot:gene1387-1408_t